MKKKTTSISIIIIIITTNYCIPYYYRFLNQVKAYKFKEHF